MHFANRIFKLVESPCVIDQSLIRNNYYCEWSEIPDQLFNGLSVNELTTWYINGVFHPYSVCGALWGDKKAK